MKRFAWLRPALVCAIAITLTLSVAAARAQTVYDFFDSLGPISGQNGGAGWAGPWAGTGNVVNAGLALACNGQAPSGNGLGPTNGAAATRMFSTATQVTGAPGTSLILSAVIKSNVNGGTATQATLGNLSGGTFIIGELPESDPNAQYWGLQNSAGVYYASGQPAASGLPAVPPKPVTANVETCLVAQIDFSVNGVTGGLDRMRLWVNPPADRSTVLPDIDRTTAHVTLFSGVFWQTGQGQIVGGLSVNSGGGVWTRLTTQLLDNFPGSAPGGVALLLTDGSVLVQGDDVGTGTAGGRTWYKFTPDIYGNYVNGTWMPVASIPKSFKYAPYSFNSAVLPDGRVIIEGGEYNFGSKLPGTVHSHGAIYDPIANYGLGGWTKLTPPPFGDTCDVNGNPNSGSYWCGVNDGGSVVLPDGTWMVGNAGGTPSGGLGKLQALLPFPYNPRIRPWIQTGGGLGALRDGNTEHGWTLLPSPPGVSALVTADTYHGFGPYGTLPTPICGGFQSSELYIGSYTSAGPVPGQWSCLGDTQVPLWGNGGATQVSIDEMGPAVLRPIRGSSTAGTVVQFGANSYTAIFGTAGKWTAGPSFQVFRVLTAAASRPNPLSCRTFRRRCCRTATCWRWPVPECSKALTSSSS